MSCMLLPSRRRPAATGRLAGRRPTIHKFVTVIAVHVHSFLHDVGANGLPVSKGFLSMRRRWQAAGRLLVPKALPSRFRGRRQPFAGVIVQQNHPAWTPESCRPLASKTYLKACLQVCMFAAATGYMLTSTTCAAVAACTNEYAANLPRDTQQQGIPVDVSNAQ